MRAISHRLLVLIVALSASLAASAQSPASGVGTVTHLAGSLTVRHDDAPARTLAVKSNVQEGDRLSTGDDTYARIKFADGGEIVMRPNSELKVERYTFQPQTPETGNVLVSLFKGGMRALTGAIGHQRPDNVNYWTPTATIGIRGTQFGALLCSGDCTDVPTVTGKPPADGLHIDVASGAVQVSNSAGQQRLSAGQFAYVQSPVMAPILVPAQQAAPVTIPSAISSGKGQGGGIGRGKDDSCTM